MKILMISSYLPYPLHSGGHVRLYNLIKELSGRHEITVICEKRPHQTREDIKEVEKICKKVVTVERRKQWSLENVLKSVFSPHSFLVTGHTHPGMSKKIQQELENSAFDVIHVETFYVLQNLPGFPPPGRSPSGHLPGVPTVLAEHNIEYSVYQKFADGFPVALRPLLSLDITKIKREEESAWKRVTGLVAVSNEDKKVMEEAGLAPYVVSNGVDVRQFGLTPLRERSAGRERKILFIGDFKWVQNRDSIEFIIKEVFPKIREKRDSGRGQNDGSVKLWIVGREIPESVRSLAKDSNIIFDEGSSSRPTPEIFQEADVLLAPIRVGGGTSYKILESMACGTPVVTMQMSADAIGAKDGEHLMVGQTAEELAEKTAQLLQDEKIYEKIAMNGRRLIEENYSWKKIAKELEKVYESLAN